MKEYVFAAIEEAVEDLKQGKMVVLVEDCDENSDGVVLVAGRWATPETISWMQEKAGGKLSLRVSEEIAQHLAQQAHHAQPGGSEAIELLGHAAHDGIVVGGCEEGEAHPQ